MVGNQKKVGKTTSFPVGLAVGGVLSICLTVLLAGIMAYLMGREVLNEDSVEVASVFILVMSSAAGAFLASGKIKSRRLMVCLLSGGIYYCLLLACTALFFSGRFQGVAATALAVLGGSGAAALVGLKGEGGSHRKLHKKFRSR